MNYSEITPRQESVLQFIIGFQMANHIAPSVREIAAHQGLRSPAGIHRILNILIEKGYLEAEAGKKRSWRVVRVLNHTGLPVIGSIAAGSPIEALVQEAERLKFDPNLFGSDRCFGLRVKGDSMSGAHIADGDIAVIRPQPYVENGEIAAVLVQDILTEATLKIVRRTKTTVTLKSASPKYPDFKFKGDEYRRVAIIGKYVGIVRGVR